MGSACSKPTRYSRKCRFQRVTNVQMVSAPCKLGSDTLQKHLKSLFQSWKGLAAASMNSGTAGGGGGGVTPMHAPAAAAHTLGTIRFLVQQQQQLVCTPPSVSDWGAPPSEAASVKPLVRCRSSCPLIIVQSWLIISR